MTEEEEAQESRRALRDAVLRVVTSVAPVIVGAWVTNTGNPRSDTLAIVWVCIFALVITINISFSFIKSRREQTYVTTGQHEVVLDKLDAQHEMILRMLTAQQHTMRQELITSAEHYLRRGWITSEEHRAWSEMYGAYDDLGLNGYMHTYLDRIDSLPLHSLDDMHGIEEG